MNEVIGVLVYRNINTTGEKVKLGDLFERVKEALLPSQHSETIFNYIGLENIISNKGELVNFEPTQGSKALRRADVVQVVRISPARRL